MDFIKEDFSNIFDLLNVIKESMGDFLSFLPTGLGAAFLVAMGTIVLVRVFK